MSPVAAAVSRVKALVPRSIDLGPTVWAQRHRWITRLLWLHAVGVLVFALIVTRDPLHAALETSPVVTLAVAASTVSLGRSTRSVVAALGLLVSSAVLVHLAGGMTEIHFHFFVMLGVIGLYQRWLPFLVAIGFVAVHHGVVGVLDPDSVYADASGIAEPLGLAGLHALFVLAASTATVASWRIIENTHRESREALEASERRFRALIDSSTDVVLVIDEHAVARYISPSSERVLGHPRRERRGRGTLELVHPDDRERVTELLDEVRTQGGSVGPFELRLRHHDGSYRCVEASLTNLLDEPAVEGIVVNYHDVTVRKELEEQLKHEAFHDALTGLANRALLLDRIQHASERAASGGRGQIAVLYIDVDDFKTVNDALGHDVGDEILRVTADRLRSVVTTGDTVARLGGDEFAVLLEDLHDPTTAEVVASSLLDAVRRSIDVRGSLVDVAASIGIVIDDGSADAAALLRNADVAMYRAKARGKGSCEVFQARMHADIVDQMARKADLRRAVDAGEIEPHYQPIVHLDTGEIDGVEALARWNHPTRGLVPPADFIELAEDTGLIVDIGSTVLRTACADMARWRDELGRAAPRTVSVNLSARQFQGTALAAEVAAALRDAKLPGTCLTLEITESVFMERSDVVIETLSTLKRLGVVIALDDFGTGYSSLNYLERFPVDVVKIDRSFVRGIGADGSGSPLVRAILDMSEALGLAVTVEGIERVEQLERLRALGCVKGQGFLFAAPMDALDLARWLIARSSGQLTTADTSHRTTLSAAEA